MPQAHQAPEAEPQAVSQVHLAATAVAADRSPDLPEGAAAVVAAGRVAVVAHRATLVPPQSALAVVAVVARR